MSITEKTYVERIVIAFNSDGTFRGASSEEHRVTLRDGEEIARESKLIPLYADDLAKVIDNLDRNTLLAQLAADAETIAEADRDLAAARKAHYDATVERDEAIHTAQFAAAARDRAVAELESLKAAWAKAEAGSAESAEEPAAL